MSEKNIRISAIILFLAYGLLLILRRTHNSHFSQWISSRAFYAFGNIFGIFLFYLLVFLSFLFLLVLLTTYGRRSFAGNLFYYLIGGFPFLYFCGRLLIRIIKTIYSTLF